MAVFYLVLQKSIQKFVEEVIRLVTDSLFTSIKGAVAPVFKKLRSLTVQAAFLYHMARVSITLAGFTQLWSLPPKFYTPGFLHSYW